MNLNCMLNRCLLFATSLLSLLPFNALLGQDQDRVELAAEVNSSFIEIRPMISADGRFLYFGRREHPENIKGDKDMQDIYLAEKVGESWGKVQNLGEPVNNKFLNSLGSVSPDGEELLMLNTYGWLKGQLASFRWQGSGWGEPQAVNIDDFHNYSEYFDFFKSYQEDVLLIAAEREDSQGEQDIYVSFKKGENEWSKPQSLGPMVNTDKSDYAPFLAADGRTLFFASYGRKGRGGADLYYVQRLDDSWKKWSKPVNLGAPINSSGEETYCSVTADGRSIYYVSYRHGSEKRDIYVSPLPPSIKLMEPLPGHKLVSTIHRDPHAVRTLDISMSVPDEQPLQLQHLSGEEQTTTQASPKQADDQPVQASLDAEASQQPTVEAGSADLGAPAAATPALAQEAVQQERASLGAAAMSPLGIELKHRAVASDVLEKKQFEVLRNIYFDFNQTHIPEGAYESMLQKVIAFMSAHPEAQVKVVGHADEKGTKGENLQVSQQRAQTVKQELVKRGLPADRILVHFRGEEEPLASNDDEREGRELNRRAVFFILLPAE